MKPFKFLQREVKGTLDNIEGEIYATASFNDDTPEGHMRRRRLYHTNLPEYERLQESDTSIPQQIEDSEMPSMIIPYQSHDIGMSNYIPPEGESYYQRFFPQVSVTKVNPKWWMKIKIVLQETWIYQPVGLVVASILFTLVTIIGIAKLLGA
jgi:hypothetical protein